MKETVYTFVKRTTEGVNEECLLTVFEDDSCLAEGEFGWIGWEFANDNFANALEYLKEMGFEREGNENTDL